MAMKGQSGGSVDGPQRKAHFVLVVVLPEQKAPARRAKSSFGVWAAVKPAHLACDLEICDRHMPGSPMMSCLFATLATVASRGLHRLRHAKGHAFAIAASCQHHSLTGVVVAPKSTP